MAIYHLSVKIIGRNQGRSAVGASAYRAGEKLFNEYDGLTHDYTRKTGIVYTTIMLPDCAPQALNDRQTLWNAVEKAERRVDAQTAREVEIALPIELNREQQIALVKNFVKENFISLGMGADVAIHDGKKATRDTIATSDNPHAHILLTTREILVDGLSAKKNRDWNSEQSLKNWREQWANTQNREYERLGLDVRVDYRTLEEQGIDREPTVKEGAAARKMEKQGIKSQRAELNRQVKERNKMRQQKKETPSSRHLGALSPEDRRVLVQIKDLEELSKTLREYEQKLESYKDQLAQASPLDLKSQNHLNDQIRHTEISKNQAIDNLQREYGIKPEEIDKRLSDLQEKAEQIRQEPSTPRRQETPDVSTFDKKMEHKKERQTHSRSR